MRACWAVTREEAPGRGFFAVWLCFLPPVFVLAHLVRLSFLAAGETTNLSGL
jgi:hypothetical protein